MNIMAARGNNNGSSKRKKDSSLRDLYAKLKKEFTAADLQKYTEIDEDTVPLKQQRKRKKR
jgi:septum formation topological specificity factor MinE